MRHTGRGDGKGDTKVWFVGACGGRVRQSVDGTYVSDVTGGAGEDKDHGGEAAGQAHATDLLAHRHHRLLCLVETCVHVRVANVLCTVSASNMRNVWLRASAKGCMMCIVRCECAPGRGWSSRGRGGARPECGACRSCRRSQQTYRSAQDGCPWRRKFSHSQ